MMKQRFLPLGLALLPGLALAHAGADAGVHHGLLDGLSHPFTGLDHLAAMLAVGFWTALAARRARADLVLVPASFAAMLMLGALLAAAGLALPAIEPMIALSLLVLGLLAAGRAALPLPWAMPLVGLFAFFHGAAHGQALGAGAALAGMLLGSLMLHLLGVAAALPLRHRLRWLPPAAGGLVALFGGSLLLLGVLR